MVFTKNFINCKPNLSLLISYLLNLKTKNFCHYFELRTMKVWNTIHFISFRIFRLVLRINYID